MLDRLKFLIHNTVAHPIAGLLWFLGLESAGNRVHAVFAPAVAVDNLTDRAALAYYGGAGFAIDPIGLSPDQLSVICGWLVETKRAEMKAELDGREAAKRKLLQAEDDLSAFATAEDVERMFS